MADARQAPRLPALSLEGVASTRTVPADAPRLAETRALRAVFGARAERLRPPLGASGGAWRPVRLAEPSPLHEAAAQLADGFQRASAPVEGRPGSRARRTHPLRGLDHPRQRACLTAGPNVFLTRPDGPTAAARFVGQKPRSRLPALLGAGDMPPAPLSPPLRAVGEDHRGLGWPTP